MTDDNINFKEILYEALLYSFGKTLAKYDVFSQNKIIEDVGREIILYLKEFGFDFNIQGNESDIMAIYEMFVKNGFAKNVEVVSTPKGDKVIWEGLYGARAYDRLANVTENPFISCPLNACLLYEARKYNKYLKLVEMKFDIDNDIAETIEVLESGYPEDSESFSTQTLESAQLIDIADKKELALKEANKEILKLANTDHLTGIMNRRAVFEITQHLCQENTNNAILMLDIDNFKSINDTYGHSVGDEVIKHIVKKCSQNLREKDIFARLGGEEFTIVLRDITLEKSLEVAQRIIDDIAKESIGEHQITTSMSIGIVHNYPKKYNSFSQALNDADKALYKAKHSGKNQYQLFSE